MSDDMSSANEEVGTGGNNNSVIHQLGGPYDDNRDVFVSPADLSTYANAVNEARGDSPGPEVEATGFSPNRRPNVEREVSPPLRDRGAVLNYFWEPLDSRGQPDRIELGPKRMRAARAYPSDVQTQLSSTLRSIFAARTQTEAYPQVDDVILDHINLTPDEIERDMNTLQNLQVSADRALADDLGVDVNSPTFQALQGERLKDHETRTQNRLQQESRRLGGVTLEDIVRAVSEGAVRQLRATTEEVAEQAAARNLKRLTHKAKEFNVEPETYMALRNRQRQMQADQQELTQQGNLLLLQMADKVRQMEQEQLRQAPGARREWARGRRGVGYRYGPQGVGRRSPWRTKRMWSSAHRDWSLFDVMGVRPLNPRVRADSETNIIARRIFGEIRPTLRQMRTVPNAPYTTDMIQRAYRLRGLPSVDGIKARKLPKLAKRHVSSIDRVLADWRRVSRNSKIDLRSMTY